MLSVRKFPEENQKKITANLNANLFPKKMSCIAVAAPPQPEGSRAAEAWLNVLGHLASDLFMLFGQLANC